MDIENIKKIHCIGIGGIGVSALARFFVSNGASVSGSDEQRGPEIKLLNEKKMHISIGHNVKNVPSDCDLVIYSSAVDAKNVELVAAKKMGIETLSYTEALGQIMTAFTSVAVSGTNGKTTTTALLGSILASANFDPTVVVGGHVSEWDTNLRLGSSDIFVAEACEYRRNMLNLEPHIIILTNIEADHLDYYRDIDDIVDAFSEYVRGLHEDDLLIYNNDDEQVREVAENTTARSISYGLSEDANIHAHAIAYSDGRQQFNVTAFDKDMGTFDTLMPGPYNVMNALGAIAACFDLGVPQEEIKKGIYRFSSTWRRFERVGHLGALQIISDYAHHPTGIKETLRAARALYGTDKKILAVFQPHQKNRTAKLFDAFVESFADADTVILAEIYEVAGREDVNEKISSKDLVREVQERGGVDTVLYAADVSRAKRLIQKNADGHDVIIVMGAGDIDGVARDLARTSTT